MRQFKSFLIVGFLVFFIDYSIYQIIESFFNPFFSRLFSYSISTWIAWRMNSKFSFSGIHGNFIQYFLGASLAGTQNVLISVLLMRLYGNGSMSNLFSIGIGCVYGLFFNYLFQTKITFRK